MNKTTIQQAQELIERLGEKDNPCNCECGCGNCECGKILIGDVLGKIYKGKNKFPQIDTWELEKRWFKIKDKYGNSMIDKSLQQILSEGVELYCDHIGSLDGFSGCQCCGKHKRLKPEVAKLLTFIRELNLK